MKTRIRLNRLWLAVIAIAALCTATALSASENPRGQILLEYVGQVINGTPNPTSSNQFGNLQRVTGVDPSLHLTFYTEATTVKVVANGPLRIVDRTGTTTIYLASAAGDFTNPDSFRSGTPVQVSDLQQQVIVDTATGAFTVVNTNTITTSTEFFSNGDEVTLGDEGDSFRSVLTGHLNSPGASPTGWFGGYAVGTKK